MPIPRAQNEQTAVSHSSTEPEIISIDAWLRMEGIPALNLWDTVIDILHRQAGGDSKLVHQTQTPKHHDPFGDIDDVPPNARLFSMRTAVYIFKDHEADLVMWARQEECQELRKVIKYMSERQDKVFGQGCNIEEGTEKHRLYHCSCWKEIRSQIPEELRTWEQRARTSKMDWK